MSTILIVEDEYAIADLLEMVLADAGYEIHIASNGHQALSEISDGKRPDLIITDFMMPVLNGAEMIAELRKKPSSRDIPFVVMSSLPEETVRESVAGYEAFLRKPFSVMRIVPLVTRILGSVVD